MTAFPIRDQFDFSFFAGFVAGLGSRWGFPRFESNPPVIVVVVVGASFFEAPRNVCLRSSTTGLDSTFIVSTAPWSLLFGS